jgi:hypothetical protein
MREHVSKDRKITITRVHLVEKMKANRSEHKAAYSKAMENYLLTYKSLLGEIGARLTAVSTPSVHLDQVKSFDWHNEVYHPLSKLEKPRHYLSAYDEAIEVFEWDEADQIELTSEEFRKYVLDKWDWKDAFATVSSRYIDAGDL